MIDRMAFSPDGRAVILEETGFDLFVWDIGTKRWAKWLKNQPPNTPEYTALSETTFPKQYVWRGALVYFPPDIPNYPPAEPKHTGLRDTFRLDYDDRRSFSAVSASRTLTAYGQANNLVSVTDLRHKRTLFTTPPAQIAHYSSGIPSYTDTLCGLCFSPDAKLLATATIHNDVSSHLNSSQDAIPGPDLEITLRNARTGEIARRWTWKRYHEFSNDTLGMNSRSVTMEFSPDSKSLAIAGDTQLKLWDVGSGTLTHTLQNSGGVYPWTHQIMFFRKRPLVASSGWQGRIQIWDIRSNRLVQVFQAQPENYYGMEMALSPDERLIANSGRTNKGRATLQVWDVSNL
ncbi:MAG: hypothetical protein ABIY70_00540 [Capsulimonas sp.]|uniref:WD40 repeat domain-containing protein n=1 Tax=Capsulimonas sp. TaxID=2494211 RepID=UPI003264A918